MIVRTRIAPSPTGAPHIGTAYVALFNICFARAHGGVCVFRLEDTDRQRLIAHAEDDIIAAMHWLGLSWDEGPGLGGDFGPYRQSERTSIYLQHVEQLLADDHAFRCFCSAKHLKERRAALQAQQGAFGYEGTCLAIDAAESESRAKAGESYVVRMKRPDSGVCRFEDQLRGRIEVDWRQVDMQVLLKADGLPTYHLANVVDDHLMQISHVIRGEEWINSTPKHLLLYQYFNWEAPLFYHLPLLRNPDKSKVSKRKNPTSLHYYRDLGLLPEALLNYLALMGYSMPDEREVFSLTEMIDVFDIHKISLGGAVFDIDKLFWLSGQWIRSMSVEAFTKRYLEWLPDQQQLESMMALVQPRTTQFSQIAGQIGYLLGTISPPSLEQLVRPNSDDAEQIKTMLYLAGRQLNGLENWDRDNLQKVLGDLAKALDLKMKILLRPLFVAISGQQVALPLFDSMVLLGWDLVQSRLNQAIEVLGGCSKKERKALDALLADF